MARKDNLVKSKSLYTIRKKHMNTNDGAIYENDHVTIISNDDIYNDGMALFSDSNFKYRIRRGNGNKKKHVRGGWARPDENSSGETWTKKVLSGCMETEETKIVNKPNYSSLKDFAYYGSAVELVKATVNDIILRFPGGLSFYPKKTAPIIKVDETDYYLVSNEFNIDCWTAGNIFSGDVKNPMRILSASYNNYVNGNGDPISAPIYKIDGECPNSIIGEVTIAGKKLKIFMDGNGNKYLLTVKTNNVLNYSSPVTIIKPKKQFIDEFWNSIDDFERVLLNRDSHPVYKAVFETPYETEDGFFYSEKDYTWPNIGDDFTPDITTSTFQGYLESLLSLAEFHDEYDSNNIWRMMTHESIKNLDWSFNRRSGDDLDDSMDSSRVQSLLNVWGRQFDDIKRFADNVKNTNNITYNEKSNIPDYFLSDIGENKGWDAKNISPSKNDEDLVISGVTVSGTSASTTSSAATIYSGYTQSDANIEFLRRLNLNSEYIQSIKGTRKGIETILGLFGYQPTSAATSGAGTYTIDEHIAIAHEFPKYDDARTLRAYCEYTQDESMLHEMQGYPVAVIEPPVINKAVDEQEDTSKWYLVPWYDRKEKYSNPIYFQEKGGWGEMPYKKINLEISSFEAISGTGIYEETEPYLHYAKDIEEMTSISNDILRRNMLCYVSDIGDMAEDYADNVIDRDDDYSHYFILETLELSNYVGTTATMSRPAHPTSDETWTQDIYTRCCGWRNIRESEFNGASAATEAGMKVLYMESLIADYKGNNPHTGKGEYDNGASYLNKFNYIFGDSISRGVFETMEVEDPAAFNELSCMGFDCQSIIDNKKCYAFYNVGNTHDYVPIVSNLSGIMDTASTTPDGIDDTIYSGFTNPESSRGNGFTEYEEAAANSIVNLKTLCINFGVGNNHFLKDYIVNVVLKYLEPMIPSTAILTYTFNEEDSTSLSAVNLLGNLAQVTADMAITEGGVNYFIEEGTDIQWIKEEENNENSNQ